MPDWALVAIDRAGVSLDKARRSTQFRLTEAKILGRMPPKAKPYEYLYQLRKCFGNQMKARRRAKIQKATLEECRQDPWFARKEQEIFEEIRDEALEQNVRVAVGASAKTKDTGHLRWFLSHIDKERWGDSKTIEHHVSGKIDVTKIDDEILELSGEP